MRASLAILAVLCAAAFARAGAQPTTITAETRHDHADVLSPGHAVLLDRHPDYTLRLEPTADLAPAQPPAGYRSATTSNGAVALDGDCGLTGYRWGVPFPTPTSGLELIWNHRLRWRGAAWEWVFVNAEVTPDGTLTRMQTRDRYRDVRPVERGENAFQRVWIYTFPDGRFRGTNQDGHLWTERVDTCDGFRTHWNFFDNDRRDRLAHERNERHFMGGFLIRYRDMIDMYSAPFDRQTFKLIGRREMIVPYDGSRFRDGHDALEDLATPNVPDQAWARYQRRDVWVVDALEREPGAHPIQRRRFYIDPQTWAILLTELYDADDQLALLHECHLSVSAEGDAAHCRPQFVYALTDDRYLVANYPITTGLPAPSATAFSHFAAQREAQR